MRRQSWASPSRVGCSSAVEIEPECPVIRFNRGCAMNEPQCANRFLTNNSCIARPALKIYPSSGEYRFCMLPNFIIVGAPRCGTTYLRQCLVEHPDIYMAGLSYTGDINFFNPGSEISAIRYYECGMAWYEGLFDGRRHETAVGEKTAHYFADPEVAARIFEHIPDARLVVAIRNPVERAYSAFWYNRGKLPSAIGFTEACQSPVGHQLRFLESGLYYQNLQRFLEFFSKDRIHIVVNDFLQRDPRQELAKLFDFLGVDSTFIPSVMNRKINGAIGPGTNIYRLRAAGHHVKQNYRGVFRMLKKLPTTWLDQYVGRRMSEISSNAGYPAMAWADRCRLEAFFDEDSREMGKHLSIDLQSMWRLC